MVGLHLRVSVTSWGGGSTTGFSGWTGRPPLSDSDSARAEGVLPRSQTDCQHCCLLACSWTLGKRPAPSLCSEPFRSSCQGLANMAQRWGIAGRRRRKGPLTEPQQAVSGARFLSCSEAVSPGEVREGGCGARAGVVLQSSRHGPATRGSGLSGESLRPFPAASVGLSKH